MKTPGTSHNYAGHGARRDTTGSPDSRIYIPSITSQEILDENASSGNKNRFGRSNSGGQRPGMNRKLLIVVALVVVAVAGAIVAFVVTKSNSSTSATNSSGANKSTSSNSTASSTGSGTTDTSSGDTSTTTSSGSGDSSTTTVGGTIKSDPTTQTYSLTAFAIGDWGATVALNGSCCSRRKGIYNGYDWHAERGVVKLMDLTAQAKKPSVIISHGDNFYWTGIDGDGDRDYRFEQTFESRHTGTNMGDVPWINVMGNHDYGGGSYICMSDSGTKACGSADELVTALQKKFTLQSTYKSPNNDRWLMKDHFYKYTVTVGDITMDIFNLDMNDAESHGANEICCQCYSYTNGDDTKCKTQTRGGEYCIKGDTAMYDACVKQFNDWSDESLASLKTEVKKSTATWKIVNSHYNPYGHYGETSGKTWLTALKDLGDVHVWMAGHTHGEKHDYASFGTHFIENGAGGGIQSESASGIPPWATGISNLWTAGGLGDPVGNTYGFFVLDASKDWLKVRYQTFDDSWVMTKDGSSLNAVTKIGGVKTAWCYYIPNDGGKGKAC